ncbi:type I-D CRISPR-associated protein Cas5/Csc1 [Candidatus Viridilinea mediisalina]|uniref:Type I-D CRISPR-associated protein Cas5/Csc1 n=1 Tax=Candidatus Viridilinea mediisalina TaxID=2024553 RepID=A0A2A6REQ5_9CHLR|nr:type I-D CRISPR-associated protein Cas5/Csc1 [Candidatus Viridilinea mediisalina]PDW01381.1 type I-D CRISPR-associated protein Cas5/Csc1 [Candidatus Viridilinea mediisalina]
MHIYRCTLTLQESLYFATREMGTLYETGQYLHNYALSYALFAQIQVNYFCASYRPRYAEDLAQLTAAGIYVTPAHPLHVDYLLATWKIGQVGYYRKSEQFGGRNYPANIGRAKELAPESTFRCYVLSGTPLRLPRWIRLGKWHSKTLVEAHEVEFVEQQGDYHALSPLNPLDLPTGTLRAFDIISMPPASLVANGRCAGPHYALANGQGLPCGMAYRFAA